MNLLVAVLLIAGALFFAVGTIGILRLPDFYTRMHAAGKCDTLAAILCLLAIALYNLQTVSVATLLVSLKVLAIVAFISVASPTATHAMTKAALIVGVKPWAKGRGPQ